MKKNILIANYIGQFVTAIVTVSFVPKYVHTLGVESYAIVSLFAVFLAGLTVIDLGLTPTISREIAKIDKDSYAIHSTIKTFFIAILIALAVFIVIFTFLTDYIVFSWLNNNNINSHELIFALEVMYFALAARWIEQFFRSLLININDAVWCNITWAGLTTIRWAAPILLFTISPAKLEVVFYAWLVSSTIGAFLFSKRLKKIIPVNSISAKASISLLLPYKKFAYDMFISAVLIFVLTNADKIIISKTLSLTELGFYALAVTISSSLLQIVGPINNSIYPSFIRHVHSAVSLKLEIEYINSCRMLAFLILPPAFTILFFTDEVLLLWTSDEGLSRHVAPLLKVLTTGTLFNCFMNIPYMLQLAHGWVSLSTNINFATVLVAIPTMAIFTKNYGAIGAASSWLLINLTSACITYYFMHKRLLPHIKIKWLIEAILQPVLVCLLVYWLMDIANNYFSYSIQSTYKVIIVTFIGTFVMYIWYKSKTISNAVRN